MTIYSNIFWLVEELERFKNHSFHNVDGINPAPLD